ncbi:MAG: dATP pyrophosphohydrolase [Hyphomicrobiales bacterium]
MSSTRDVEIRPVENKPGIDAFIRAPFAIFADDQNWVPPLFMERRDHLSAKKNPYFQHADTQLFTAWRDGRCIGRISAQVCALHQVRYRAGVGNFGFLDAIDDVAVFRALLNQAEAWLKQKGMKVARGPYSFSINQESGLLVDGFNTPQSVMMGHAKPYYSAHVEACDYKKAMDLIAYDYDAASEMPRAMRSMAERAQKDGSLKIRPLDKKNLKRDLEIIINLFNDAWSENWDFVPMTQAEIDHLGQNLKMLVTGQFVAIAEYEGKPAAMAVTMPNINAEIADLNGRSLPFGWAKLLWRLKARPPKSVRMPLMGVAKEHQTSPVGAALAISVIDAIRSYHSSRGTMRAELSWILETNTATRKIIEALGGDPYKTYRIYERAL